MIDTIITILNAFEFLDGFSSGSSDALSTILSSSLSSLSSVGK